MRRSIALLALLTIGCSWSNSLYHARRLSGSALKAEREDRGFEAGSLWGRAAVKADSAYARSPEGRGGSEALWLRGRALARMGDCRRGMPLLERAQVTLPDAAWSTDLTLELARCRLALEEPILAIELLEPLLQHRNSAVRTSARELSGRALLAMGDWGRAEQLLDGDDSSEGIWLHAQALARMGRDADAVRLLEPRLESADTTTFWDPMLLALAETPESDPELLLVRLQAIPGASDGLRARWLATVAQGRLTFDDSAGVSYLRRVLELPRSAVVTQARIQLAERSMAASHDIESLRGALGQLNQAMLEDPASAFIVNNLVQSARSIDHELDSLVAGAPEGDMALLYHASVAEERLDSPRLAAFILARLERDWPESPYVPKALLIRMRLEPDSTQALQSRLESHQDSPYLAFVQGRDDPRFAELEYALDFFIGDRAVAATPTGVN